MKKTLILFIFLTFSFNISVNAEEKKCKTFDVACKMGKVFSDTKEFQKKGLKKSKEQIKSGVKK
jgi:hypothetical protein